MPKQLLIIGAGHTGTSAALAAARQRHLLGQEEDVTITLMNPSAYLGIRPRYYEYELEQTQRQLNEFLTPVNVKILLGKAETIDLEKKIVSYQQEQRQATLTFDRIILAMGSELIQSAIPGMAEHTFNIDTFEQAKRLRYVLEQHIINQPPSGTALRIAILGGGLAGIELATELPVSVKKICAKFNQPLPTLQITLLDRHQISRNISAHAQPYIEQALQLAQVTCIDHASIDEIVPGQVRYNQENCLASDLIVSTLGLRANPLTATLAAEKDALGRIKVNHSLQDHHNSNCFVAGDCATLLVDDKHNSVMSCQQGRRHCQV